MTVAIGKLDTAQQFKVIGTRPIRPDGYEKVTGKAVYGGDVRISGMVWGEVLRSPYAHARIKSINTTAALKMPGVLAAITYSDLPPADTNEVPWFEWFVRPAWKNIKIIARDKVLYTSHIVAAVAAVDRNTALEALKRIKVEYEPLKPVLDIDEAVASDAPIILEDLVGDHLGKRVPNTNIAWQFRYEFGDPEKAFKQCSLVVEREVTLKTVHQGYIEPHNATAVWEPNGQITVWTSTQGAFSVRTTLAAVLGVPETLIRVMPVEIGGGFGGKATSSGMYLELLAAVLSKKTGRPVKMLMDRKSVFEGTGPAPGGRVRVKLGVNDRGRILAGDAELRFEAGGIPGSWVSVGANCIFSTYDIPNTRIQGYDILVNKPKSGAYRAPSVPQSVFATEQVVDEICEKKGWDKIEFRLWNASREGTRRADCDVIFGRIGLIECLEAARSSEHWGAPLEKKGPNGRVRGRGIAVGYMWQGGGKSAVDLTVGSDGVVHMNEGSVDIGGTRASIAMQAAEVLGIPVEDVQPTIPDTDSIGFTGTTGASRTTNATGLAAYRAALAMIDALKARAAATWNRDLNDIDFKDGIFFSKSDSGLALTFKKLCAYLDRTGGPARSAASVNLPVIQPGRREFVANAAAEGHYFAIGICDLEVDPETGKVDVLRYTAIQDVGKAVHPSYVEGQMQGGTVQGIGWALNEEYCFTEDGVMANSSFLDYRMPTPLDVPKIDTIIVEVPNPLHPFGVKGSAEISIAPPLGAVANALHDALGVRFVEQPMKPGRILDAIARTGGSNRTARTPKPVRRH